MDSKYTFTEDWFSEQNGEPVIREFNKFLSPYAGKPCKFLEIGSYEGKSSLSVDNRGEKNAFSTSTMNLHPFSLYSV